MKSIIILLLIALNLSLVYAESCTCDTVSSTITPSSSTSLRTKYCLSISANAYCVSGHYSGNVDFGCYNTKDSAQTELDNTGKSFQCYYQNGTLTTTDPSAGGKVIVGAVVISVIVLVIFCCCTICLVGITGVGLLMCILGKNKGFMRFIGNSYMRRVEHI